MAEQYHAEWARGVIDGGVKKAQNIINDPSQIDTLLEELQKKLGDLPSAASSAFKNVPLMVDMVKSYVTREYTNVSPKVVISLVSAFLYLVKRNDLIPDGVPIIGLADDLAVATIALIINEPELKAYAAWREQQTGTPVRIVSVDPLPDDEAPAEPVAE